jgi:hypothetical protein
MASVTTVVAVGIESSGGAGVGAGEAVELGDELVGDTAGVA